MKISDDTAKTFFVPHCYLELSTASSPQTVPLFEGRNHVEILLARW